MKKIITILAVGLMVGACNDDAFLRERPDDFLTMDNAFLNVEQFRTGINQMYAQVRAFYNSADSDTDWVMMGAGTDVFMLPRGNGSDLALNDWLKIDPNNSYVNRWWDDCFAIIKNSNELLKQTENEKAVWIKEGQKEEIQSEIRFFRAYAYRCLAHLFGDVPILKEPITGPKLDFLRDKRIDVYKFCIEDLEFAAKYLPTTTSDKGRIVRAVADHLLAEVYIAYADNGGDKSGYTNAIQATTRVLDGTDGNYSLMKSRFGTRANEAGKNVYWDLFRMGNQNYQDGNLECLWAVQFEYNTPGGTNVFDRPLIERVFWPSFWQIAKFGYDGVARDWTGRGVAVVRPTNFSIYTLWANAGTDMRNSEVNISRKFYAPKPIINGVEADYDTIYSTPVVLANGTELTIKLRPGDEIKKEWLTTRDDTMSRYYPRFFKFGTDKHINGKPDNGYVRDIYVFRLAETYLLRAEASLKSGSLAKAAADINEVRARSEAAPVNVSQVNMDYLLDERARELLGEEYRTMTLCRMNLLYDRTKRFGFENSAKTVREINNLFPIPQSAIDANLDAELIQNPGY